MNLEDLRFDPIAQRFPQERLFTFSGRGSAGMIPDTVLGIRGFFLPPISGRNFRFFHRLRLPEFDMTVGDSNDQAHFTPPKIMLQELDWLPWRIRRRGIFHHQLGKSLVCFHVESELTVASDSDAILVRLRLELASPRCLKVEIEPEILDPAHSFGACVSGAWNYEPPAAQGIVWSEGSKTWRTDGYVMRLVAEGVENTARGWKITLESGRPRDLTLGIIFKGDGLTPPDRSLRSHALSAERYWRGQFDTLKRRMGSRLEKIPTRHQKLFLRGWTTAMTSRWDRSNFITRPFYSAEGIDGGSVCSYLWDLSYASHFLSQLEGRRLGDLIARFADPEKFFTGYSLSPLNGQWLGVFYAFDPYALVKCIVDYLEATGDSAFLRKKVGCHTLLGATEMIVETFDKSHRGKSGLLDFGHNRHLIELLTAGYEGLTPNPNFEHAWSFKMLNRMRSLAGLRMKSSYTRRSQHILKACERQFWNPREGWYFPAAQRMRAGIWSIQILSALRLGVFPKRNVEKMASHLCNGRFLGPHGIFSIARDDTLHFTLNDVDWGGGGCFTGHTGIILEGLLQYGLRDKADEILERIEWWGTGLPYIPQSTRADATTGVQDRPNAVAAGALCQSLLAGI